jgi:transcriptional regulator with XRE-family HTH domain
MEHRPLKDLRSALKLTQDDVALVAGVNKSRVSQVEAGNGSFKRETWLRVYDHWRLPLTRLGYSLEDLLRGGGKGQRRKGEAA